MASGAHGQRPGLLAVLRAGVAPRGPTVLFGRQRLHRCPVSAPASGPTRRASRPVASTRLPAKAHEANDLLRGSGLVIGAARVGRVAVPLVNAYHARCSRHMTTRAKVPASGWRSLRRIHAKQCAGLPRRASPASGLDAAGAEAWNLRAAALHPGAARTAASPASRAGPSRRSTLGQLLVHLVHGCRCHRSMDFPAAPEALTGTGLGSRTVLTPLSPGPSTSSGEPSRRAGARLPPQGFDRRSLDRSSSFTTRFRSAQEPGPAAPRRPFRVRFRGASQCTEKSSRPLEVRCRTVLPGVVRDHTRSQSGTGRAGSAGAAP